MLFTRQIPADNDSLRAALYDGAVFKMPATEISLSLVRHVQKRLDPTDNGFEGLTKLRREIIAEPFYQDRIRVLIESHGFDVDGTAFDYLRLRAALHGGHKEPAAKRSYSMHRDTWYANPQCQINWWIPLHDIEEDQAFSFYPEYFNRAVQNTSEDFDYGDWKNKVGWQSTKGVSDIAYPEIGEQIDTQPVSFSAKAGEIIMFSSAHLHQTNKIDNGQDRFSIDFRTVYLPDHKAGLGAPNVDNASRPDALDDYVMPKAQGVAA